MDPNRTPAENEPGNGNTGGGPKPPPWQVPQPELRPELQQPGFPQQPGVPQPGGPQGFPQQPPVVVDPFAREHAKQAAEAQHRKKRSQRRTLVVGLGVTALLAGTITAIVASSENEADYAQVCFNEETGERVEDTNCGSSAGRSSGVYAWYFYSRGSSVPGLGQSRSSYPNYTRNVPSGAKTSSGYSTKGGTVSRGGFGGSSKGGSSGG